MFSTRHKTIGLQYLWLSLASVLVGMVLSALLRVHSSWPDCGHSISWRLETTPERYAAVRLLHGSLMVFFVLTAAPQLGFGNFLLPLQIGAEEMAFPSLNRLSLLDDGGVAVRNDRLVFPAAEPRDRPVADQRGDFFAGRAVQRVELLRHHD